MPVDPITGLEYIEFDGHRRILACLPPPADFGGLPKWRAANPTIPRDQWQEVDYSHLACPILDQDGHGSCVGHGACGAFETTWNLSGNTPQRFSSCFLYGLINGNRDAGANISSALQALMDKGIALLSQVPEGMIYQRQFPAEAFTTAQRFKVGEGYHLQSFDDMGSALQMGFLVVYGLYVGGDFGNLNSEGVAPAHGGMGNHCMYGVGLKRLASGQWAIRNRNSWGERWGNQGTCLLVERHFYNGSNDPDAFAIKAVMEDPQDTNMPPKVA